MRRVLRGSGAPIVPAVGDRSAGVDACNRRVNRPGAYGAGSRCGGRPRTNSATSLPVAGAIDNPSMLCPAATIQPVDAGRGRADQREAVGGHRPPPGPPPVAGRVIVGRRFGGQIQEPARPAGQQGQPLAGDRGVVAGELHHAAQPHRGGVFVGPGVRGDGHPDLRQQQRHPGHGGRVDAVGGEVQRDRIPLPRHDRDPTAQCVPERRGQRPRRDHHRRGRRLPPVRPHAGHPPGVGRHAGDGHPLADRHPAGLQAPPPTAHQGVRAEVGVRFIEPPAGQAGFQRRLERGQFGPVQPTGGGVEVLCQQVVRVPERFERGRRPEREQQPAGGELARQFRPGERLVQRAGRREQRPCPAAGGEGGGFVAPPGERRHPPPQPGVEPRGQPERGVRPEQTFHRLGEHPRFGRREDVAGGEQPAVPVRAGRPEPALSPGSTTGRPASAR